MNAILEYIVTVLPFMLSALPMGILARVLYCKIHPRRFNPYHEVGLMLLVMCLTGLAAHTLLPRLTLSGGTLILEYKGLSGINLQPFQFVKLSSYKNYEYFIINCLGNIGIFLPPGLLIPLLWKIKPWQVVLLGSGTSLLIELLQLALPRYTDIDDFMLNTLGAFLGVLIYKYLHPSFVKKFKI
ncbi:MAG: VanZ family protein [Clostridia bacterium]|nr:VanZ family protein [Clostridia bacterium]